jgi:hypothetical protein
MKKIFLAIIMICVCIASIAQKNKIYATVFDEDNNPIARGIFKIAADSGVIILVDDMEIFVNATEITVLKIEKNSSKAEFLKLGATTATDMASYLINKPKKESESEETDSIGAETNPISTETKDALFLRINNLMENLLIGKNDLATMNINNSPEKFLTKLRLLQEYSMGKEIVVWNDYSQSQQPVNEIQNPDQDSVIQNETAVYQAIQTDETIQTESSSSPVNPQVAFPVKSKTVTLGKGFLYVKPTHAAIKPVAVIPVKDNEQIPVNKNVAIEPAKVKPATTISPKDNKQASVNKNITTVKPTSSTSQKTNAPISTNKNVIIIPISKTSQQNQPKSMVDKQKKLTVNF